MYPGGRRVGHEHGGMVGAGKLDIVGRLNVGQTFGFLLEMCSGLRKGNLVIGNVPSQRT